MGRKFTGLAWVRTLPACLRKPEPSMKTPISPSVHAGSVRLRKPEPPIKREPPMKTRIYPSVRLRKPEVQ